MNIVNYMRRYIYIFVCICISIYICVLIYKYSKFKHRMFTCIYTYVAYIGRLTRRSTCVPDITGSASLEVRVMEQAPRESSNFSPVSGRITRVRTFIMTTVLSWSSGD